MPDGVPIVDVAGFLLLFDSITGPRRWDRVVLSWLHDPGPGATARPATAQRELGGDPLDTRTVVLPAWLQHVVTNIDKSTRYGANPVWLHRAVVGVLSGLRTTP